MRDERVRAGEREGAARAFSRALQIADRHRNLLSSTALNAIGRALTYRDLPSARAALQTGIEAGLEEDSLVYGALWLMFLECF